MLKVVHYSGDKIGGAARAATRLHQAFYQHGLVDSKMIVTEKLTDDYTIREINTRIWGKFGAVLKPAIDSLPGRIAKTADSSPRSAGWASRISSKDINSTSSDISHLHWINGGFLSIEEIGKITKPLVWTVHDMWPFCGAEHLASDAIDARWRTGYDKSSKIDRFDIDRWVWRRKAANWTKPIHIITPSRWIYECVRQSELMRNFPTYLIPNTLDINIYKPMDKLAARRLLNLPDNHKLILFGAIKGTQLPYKGWDLLKSALCEVAKTCPHAEAVIFGQGRPQTLPQLPIKVHWMGHIHDDFTLAAIYSAADTLVIPSRQESFGQTGSEAQACGCPVVAFNTTGLKDVVADGITGFLAQPYDPSSLAAAIVTLLQNDHLSKEYGTNARQRAVQLWSYPVVARQHLCLYENVLRACS